ncbi:MAG: serine hydrolase [Leptolyngbyaceae cyanobacterium]
MEAPPHYRSKQLPVRWLILSLGGFVAGSLLAAGLALWQSRTSAPPLAANLCTRISPSRGDVSPHPNCRSVPPVSWRSPWQTVPTTLTQGLDFYQAASHFDQPRYPVANPPPFVAEASSASPHALERIVWGAVGLLADKGLPTDVVSVSLVDLKAPCCQYAQFQDQQARYPASVVKLFWLVALYNHYQTGRMSPEAALHPDDELLTVHYSNNGAASRVLDAVTQTQSGASLTGNDWADWLAARQTINDYFLRAHYPDLNIAHKTFPVPDLGMTERTGRDLQFAAGETLGKEHPLTRNYLTTRAAARLLYEIETGQAVAAEYSDRLKAHLRHSTDPAIWQTTESNAIAGFFGEYLPPDVQLYTKLGFTFDEGRQEAAIIISPDNQTRFVLVMFANDPMYSTGDVTAFPAVARYIYDRMQQRQATPP